LLLWKEDWLMVFNTKTNESRKLNIKPPSALFKILRDTNDNSFWGCSNEGLVHFSLTPSGQVFREIGKIKIPQSKCNDFLLLPQNKQILIATNTGILIYELNSLKIKNEVPFSFERYPISVLSLLSEKNGRIWTSTSSGIIVFNLKSGEHYALNKSHGLLNTEFCSGSAMQMINGEMMFGGLNTYELLSPLKFDGVKYENDFLFQQFNITKKNGSKWLMKMNGDVCENIELLSGKEQVLIFLANKDLIESANYKFEYRINENSWVLLNRNTPILIADLPYGEHKLQIRMINPFGNKCADKIFLINSVIPFYQRSGFLFTLILLVLGLSVYSYFSFRKTKRISDETKERIAMELHDEAGTVLTRLSLLLSGKSDLNKNRELLVSGINEALISVRTSISSFSQRSFKILNLEDGIKEFINKAIVNTDIAWSFRKSYDNDSTISSELYRDIKLCVYEVFTNILKHANCKNIFIELKREKDIMVLKISDDGVVTDTKQITEEGNGIGNIRKRVKRNMGDCNFSVSEGGSGLTVELKFPIK
jgi:hypothetical protein